jgi:hypothetical protein
MPVLASRGTRFLVVIHVTTFGPDGWPAEARELRSAVLDHDPQSI